MNPPTMADKGFGKSAVRTHEATSLLGNSPVGVNRRRCAPLIPSATATHRTYVKSDINGRFIDTTGRMLDLSEREYTLVIMVVVRMLNAEPLKRSVRVLIALVFLSANMAINRHVVHTDLAKLITVDHQVRRDLTRAERENLKTSVVSDRGELIVNPPQEAAGISPSQEIVVDSYPIPHSLTQLQPKSISLDFSPVLNL